MAAQVLKIDIFQANKATPPAALEARLQTSPTKEQTPEALAESIDRASCRAAALRAVYLDAVKDRAARESQRAADAAARKRRLATSRVDKVKAKLEAASSHAAAKKEADEEARQAKKAKREEQANAVSAARNAAAAARLARQAELAEIEKLASSKHTKALAEVVAKSHKEVAKSVAVVAAHKEKETMALAEASDRLEAKLSRAALSRASRLSKEGFGSSPAGAKTPDALHRVLNEAKVASETRRKSLDASMAKAAAKREAMLEATAAKGHKESLKVRDALEAKNESATNDAASARANLYERLLKAEVARLSTLKERTTKGGRFPAPQLVVVEVAPAKTRTPPSTLLLRLSAAPTTLVATAPARQVGAAARRATLASAKAMRYCKAAERRAAAVARVAKMAAALVAKAHAKANRAKSVRQAIEKQRQSLVAAARTRAAAAAAARKAAEGAIQAAGVATQAKHARADERVAAAREAKKSAAASRVVAAMAKREEIEAGALVKSLIQSALNTAADDRRTALLAKRVGIAKAMRSMSVA